MDIKLREANKKRKKTTPNEENFVNVLLCKLWF